MLSETYRMSQFYFNTTIVRFKLEDILKVKFVQNDFNTTIVRFKPLIGNIIRDFAKRFQYYNSTIQTEIY